MLGVGTHERRQYPAHGVAIDKRDGQPRPAAQARRDLVAPIRLTNEAHRRKCAMATSSIL
jgi:hypothetical protein